MRFFVFFFYSDDSDELFFQPQQLSKYFTGKRFREGSAIAAIGQTCYWHDDPPSKKKKGSKKGKKGKKPLGKCFCTIQNISGAQWTVKFHDDSGEEEMDSRRFTLAHQKGQQILIGDVLYDNAGYTKTGVHLTKAKDQSGKKRMKITPMQVKRARTRRNCLAPASASVDNVSKNKHKVDAEELAVAALCAVTKPADPDRETLDEQHLRIGAAFAGGKQLENLPEAASAKQSEATSPKVVARWIKCKAGPLTPSERALLCKFASSLSSNRPGAVSWMFAERAMQEYKSMQKSTLHLNSRNVFAAAIGQVMTQVRPQKDQPFCGKVTAVFDILYPMAKVVFNIKDPAAGKQKGGWIKKILSEDSYTYNDCEKQAEVMAHHVQAGIRNGPPPKVKIINTNKNIVFSNDSQIIVNNEN